MHEVSNALTYPVSVNISIFRIKLSYECFWARWLREVKTASFVSFANRKNACAVLRVTLMLSVCHPQEVVYVRYTGHKQHCQEINHTLEHL